MSGPPQAAPRTGDRIELDIDRVAHGGTCVGRHAGQVVFVRGTLPGERVVAVVTGSGKGDRFLRADTVEVLRPAAGRRTPLCPVAGRCGGCDWQHATVPTARELKTAVVREALDRFAGVDLPAGFAVAEVPVPDEVADGPGIVARLPGLGWRTRATLRADASGRLGLRAARSHEVVVAGTCPQLDPRLAGLGLFTRAWPAGAAVRAVVAGDGTTHAIVGGAQAEGAAETTVRETVLGRTFEVAAAGFWQVHPGAAAVLVGHVQRLLDPRPGERLLDLYSGVGLFGISLAAAEPGLTVHLVEGDRTACALAERNGSGLSVTVRRADVSRWVGRRGGVGRRDLVVLDPPRTGAGATVVRAVAAARPRALAYVACDPVALARDLRTFGESGYRLRELVGLDLFPTTHHVECIALLERT